MHKLFAAFVGLFFISITHASEPYERLPEKFIELLRQSKQDEAFDSMFSTNKWISPESDQVKALRSKLSQDIKLVGEYKYFELLSEQKVGERWSRVTYAIGFERQPIIFTFDLYKPDDNWIISSFTYNMKLSLMLEKPSFGSSPNET